MARDNKSIAKASRNIQDIANGISGNMDALYRSTYMTSPQQGKDLQDLNDRINDNIDKIVTRNIDTVGMPSVSKLYTRAAGATGSNSSKVTAELEKMFDNGMVTDDLYEMFMSNRYLKELDNEIDTVCRYMPELEEALAVQKDCVLSADHFSKDFLTFQYPGSGVDEKQFSERVKDLKRKYELAKLTEEIYDDTSKYGEKFIYRVPYATAIGKLLATKPNAALVAPIRSGGNGVIGENFTTEGKFESKDLFGLEDSFYMISMDSKGFSIYSESGICEQKDDAKIITESVKHVASGKDVTTKVESSILADKEHFNLRVEICKSGVLESAVQAHKEAFEKRTSYSKNSLVNIRESELSASGSIGGFGKQKKDKRIISNDGLIDSKPEPVPVKAPGCVIRKLAREQVLPIYIEDMCMGYYYFELRSMDHNEAFMGFRNIMGDALTNMRTTGDSRPVLTNAVDTQRQDETIRYVAGQLSKFIDKQFVNNNQDLAKEIYMILKYNDLFNTPSIDMIKVTFIPPEDMVHFFFKQDPITHRGVSDLSKGLIPAKIYSSLYLSGAIGNLTRGQDRRAYYVTQTVDTNIAQTLLNTISQIKQGNFGIRQFQNINNILNIIGKFNDFVIPTNASGEPPIRFEIIPGQEINMPTELMDQLKEAAINTTGIPIEIIQSRNSVDYAMQLTMSSSKVLRFCYKRQELFENDLTRFISPIYNYEYDETSTIDIKLPPPSFINVTNTNQLVDNTKNFVNSVVEVEMADEQDDHLKAVYTNELFKHYIGSHLDISAHEAILRRAKILAKQETDESHGIVTDNSGDYGDYESY